MVKRTNKNVLAKGIKIMAIAMLLLVLGPLALHFGFQVRNYLSLIIAGIICIAAIITFIYGIRTLMKALFND